jgi:hypothetical protein
MYKQGKFSQHCVESAFQYVLSEFVSKDEVGTGTYRRKGKCMHGFGEEK